MKSSPEKVMGHTEGKVFPLLGIRVVKEFDYMRVVAERDALVKALRSARDYLDEQYPMIDASELLDEEIDPILSRYPENK